MTHTAVSQANSALQLPTLEHVYALLKANCKPDRFDGRDGPVWGQEYCGIWQRSLTGSGEIR
jgi:hypothetical protein